MKLQGEYFPGLLALVFIPYDVKRALSDHKFRTQTRFIGESCLTPLTPAQECATQYHESGPVQSNSGMPNDNCWGVVSKTFQLAPQT